MLEERHLTELDTIIDRYGEGRKLITVFLRPDRSCSLNAFSEIAHTDLMERFVVSSIQGDGSTKAGRFSISISGSGTSSACFRYSADATEDAIDSFDHAIKNLIRRIKPPYRLLYEPKSDFLIGLAFMVILMAVMTFTIDRFGPKINAPEWLKIIALSGISNILGQIFLYAIKETLPPFVISVGEGKRWYQRKLGLWKFLIPRAAWQLVMVCVTIIFGWLFYLR